MACRVVRLARRRVFAGIALLALMLAGCGPSLEEMSPETRALALTERAFDRQEVHGDAAFLLSQGAQASGRRIAVKPLSNLEANRYTFPYSIEYRLWLLRDKPVPQMSVVVPERGALPFDRMQAVALREQAGDRLKYTAMAQDVLRVMASVLECSDASVKSLFTEAGYGYTATHQVVGVMVSVLRGCLSASEAAQILPPYVARVRDEFMLDLPLSLLTDLQIERAAMLCMAGHCNLVPARFRERLVREQAADGMWHLQDPLIRMGLLPDMHPTALAYYVLSHPLPAAAGAPPR